MKLSSLTFAFAGKCGLLVTSLLGAVFMQPISSSAAMTVFSAQRIFEWKDGADPAIYVLERGTDEYRRTEQGVTLSSTAITDTGFSMHTTVASPTDGSMWREYAFLRFEFSEDTTMELSGTLYSPVVAPRTYQYTTVQEKPFAGAMIFDETNNGGYDVVGPKPFSFTHTYLANTPYAIESSISWVESRDGFTGSFFKFAPVSAPVPEPGSTLLAGLTAIGLLARRRRQAARDTSKL